MTAMSAATSITCPRCRRTSHNPTDVAEGYCGACHDWTSMPKPPLTPDDYAMRLPVVVAIARSFLQVAETAEIERMLELAGQLEAIAPILAPTAYRDGGDLNLADQQAFLAATAAYVTALKELDRRR